MNSILRHFSNTKSYIGISKCFNHPNPISKSDLSKLRKTSGFPFSKCKEALMQHDGNVEEAHEWLKQEAVKHGWSKMGKLSERPMSNGLIGFLEKNNCSLLLELNCETDFVARNDKFHKLLDMAANACIDTYYEKLERKFQHFNTDILGKIIYNNDTLENHLAAAVGSLGENMLLRRAVVFRKDATDFSMSYLHFPWNDMSNEYEKTGFGKYAAIMRYRRKIVPDQEDESLNDWLVRTQPISRSICQHIVAMNPKRIGKLHDEEDAMNLKKEEKKAGSVEDRLLYQEYIIDELKQVHEISEPNGLDIRDFVRYECGVE